MAASSAVHDGADVRPRDETAWPECFAPFGSRPGDAMDVVEEGRVGTAEVPVGKGLLSWSGCADLVSTLPLFEPVRICTVLVLAYGICLYPRRSTFSGAFKTGAFYLPSKSSIAFNIVINLVFYSVFTVICFYAAYPPQSLTRNINKMGAESEMGLRLPQLLKRALTVKQLPKVEVIAVCFCGAAKTTSVGIPLAAAMWAEHDDLTKSLVQVPILLYTTEQVFVAQFLTIFFRWWLDRGNKTPGTEPCAIDAAPREASLAPAADGNGRQ